MSDNTQPSALTIADLNNLKLIIEASTQRGAFRANELASIGQTYDKLAAFLASATTAAVQDITAEKE